MSQLFDQEAPGSCALAVRLRVYATGCVLFALEAALLVVVHASARAVGGEWAATLAEWLLAGALWFWTRRACLALGITP